MLGFLEDSTKEEQIFSSSLGKEAQPFVPDFQSKKKKKPINPPIVASAESPNPDRVVVIGFTPSIKNK